MTAFLSVNGLRAVALELFVPEQGPWFADVSFDDTAALAGSAALVIGATTLVGSVDPQHTGAFQLRTRARILGGAGWRNSVPARHFHTDAGIKLAHVVNTTAGEVGETVEGIDAAARIGVDYVRTAGRAARVLGLLDTWRVDFDGVTRPGARIERELPATVALLDFAPADRVATLMLDDVSDLLPGCIIRDRLEVPMRVRAVEVQITADKLRAQAWCEEAA